MMYFSIITVVGGILVIPLALYQIDYDFDSMETRKIKKFLYSIFAIIGTILIVIDIAGAIAIEFKPWTYKDQPNAVEKIVCLSDNNMVTGKFYIRRGYIEQDLWYQYMVALDDGGFASNKLKSSDTTLYYSDGNYRVEWWSKSRKWLWLYQTENYHKIFIPYGSITDEYSIDLK